ncbi:hypothetical protein ABZP36_029555 [Zizania latifolia]
MDLVSDSDELSDEMGKVDIPEDFEQSEDKKNAVLKDSYPRENLTDNLENVLALAAIPTNTSAYVDMLMEIEQADKKHLSDPQTITNVIDSTMSTAPPGGLGGNQRKKKAKGPAIAQRKSARISLQAVHNDDLLKIAVAAGVNLV